MAGQFLPSPKLCFIMGAENTVLGIKDADADTDTDTEKIQNTTPRQSSRYAVTSVVAADGTTTLVITRRYVNVVLDGNMASSTVAPLYYASNNASLQNAELDTFEHPAPSSAGRVVFLVSWKRLRLGGE